MSSHRHSCTLSICLYQKSVTTLLTTCAPPQQCCSINLPKISIFFSANVANLLVMTSRLAGRRDSRLARKICILKHIPYYLLSITMPICACAIYYVLTYMLLYSIVPYFFPIKSQCSKFNLKYVYLPN